MLVPTFHACFPGKTMVLFVDNAPYHRCQGPEGEISINSCNRPELIEWLAEKCDDQDIDSVSWDRTFFSHATIMYDLEEKEFNFMLLLSISVSQSESRPLHLVLTS